MFHHGIFNLLVIKMKIVKKILNNQLRDNDNLQASSMTECDDICRTFAR